jgi:CRP-like cAMP-binding protein
VAGSDSNVRVLKEVSFFCACAPSEVEALSRSFTEAEVAAGTDVIRQGDDSREFYVIVSGTADVLRDGTVIRSLGPGDFFGEIANLLHARRTATITATSTLRLLVSDEPSFRQAVRDTPGLYRKLIEALAERLAPTAL